MSWSCTEDQHYTGSQWALWRHSISPHLVPSYPPGLRDLKRPVPALNLNVHVLKVLHMTRVLGLLQSLEID